MSTRNKLRPALDGFSQVMEATLIKNDFKTGWEGERIMGLFRRLREETDELLLAIGPLQLNTKSQSLTTKDAEHLVCECADIANFAMMIADNVQWMPTVTRYRKIGGFGDNTAYIECNGSDSYIVSNAGERHPTKHYPLSYCEKQVGKGWERI